MGLGFLQGRHAIVTGGGRGIGRAVAAALARDGATVTVLGRTEASLREAVAAGDAAAAEVADVTDEAALRAAITRAVEQRGPVAILVNNAGGASSQPFARTGADEFRRMLELNLMGCVHGCQAVLPSMLEAGYGRIVNVASTAGLKGYPYVSAYVAAKHAVVGLTRALAQETARAGVTVNAVCPGFTDTDLVAESVARITAATGRSAEAARDSLARSNPQGRLVRPEEVADGVAFLCRASSGAMTGLCLPVAGGEVP
ncbi:SDR family NAD(P)-dependent oxidoreductase [Roseomonas sp. BN140053]|uniref:SDR family NAD(P)-dependent oxidoreductase n=1 Tax=Roseomonas sp. BN140053 TaxID=3391898 RepID=UPI0039E97918